MSTGIQPTNERMVYRVESDRNPKITYRVDLLSNQGGGKCSCTDYSTRRQPFIDRGGDAWTPLGTCKHVLKARLHLIRELLIALAEEEGRDE